MPIAPRMTTSPNTQHPVAPGLVLSDKAEPFAPLWTPTFLSSQALREAAQALASRVTGPSNRASFYRYFVELSPASVRVVRRKDPDLTKTQRTYAPRKPIAHWSRKSRARMTARLATLDYSAMPWDAQHPPAMLTLTYPGDWLRVAPNGKVAKEQLKAFRRRYRSTFGVPLVGLWKMEFQKRGAPHFHILCVPPQVSLAKGGSFAAWASTAWADTVAAPEPKERAQHLRAGTGLDYKKGLHADDARRVAMYFSKHSWAGGKDYQHEVPAAWLDAGSVGRFWGYWGLRPMVEVVPVSKEEADFVARTMRRWAKANAPRSQKRRVLRVDTQTGEMKRRTVHRRVAPRRAGYGFAIVPDGAQMARALGAGLAGSRQSAPIVSPRGDTRGAVGRSGADVREPLRERLKREATRTVVLARLLYRRVRSARPAGSGS